MNKEGVRVYKAPGKSKRNGEGTDPQKQAQANGKISLESENLDLKRKGGVAVGVHIFADIANELLGKEAWLRRYTSLLPWVIRIPHLQARFTDELVAKSDNLRSVNVLAIPTFPERGGDRVQFLKLVFIHVKRLEKATIDEIIFTAKRAKVKATSHTQTEVWDTDIILIADETERGANRIFEGKARRRTAAGNTGTMYFAAKRGRYIKKFIYEILSRYLRARADKVKEAAETTLRNKGIQHPELFGDLKTCVEFVRGLGEKLGELAGKIKLPIGRYTRKSKERMRADKLVEGATMAEESALNLNTSGSEEDPLRAKMAKRINEIYLSTAEKRKRREEKAKEKESAVHTPRKRMPCVNLTPWIPGGE